MSIEYRFKPLERWPHTKQTSHRKRSGFRCTLNKVYQDLTRELEHIKAKGVVYVEAAVQAKDIRIDGLLRAEANPRTPHIVIYAPETAKGPMRFACDTFQDWRENVRAISMTLTALRAVSRYGSVQDNEQYKGFAALPPPDGGLTVTDASNAAAYIYDLSRKLAVDTLTQARELLVDIPIWLRTYRALVKRVHPDGGGNEEMFKRFMHAAELIDQHLALKRVS